MEKKENENKPEASQPELRCPTCGAQVEPGDRICPECGTSLNQSQPENRSASELQARESQERGSQASQPQTGAEPARQPSQQPASCPPREVHSSGLIWLGAILLIFVGVLELIGGFGFGSIIDILLGLVLGAIGVLLAIQAYRTPTQRPTA